MLSACTEATIEKAEPASATTQKENTSQSTDKQAEEQPKEEVKEEVKEVVKEEPKEDDVPREHKAALKTAQTYAESMHMSKAGIYDQLTSEYGEDFEKEAAQYAIDNIEFDWKENALKTAQSYAESMSMSDSAIYDQLISEYGEKFTEEEAQYAIDNLD
ncbi:Ltp family lipoprotein [Mycolicibacterium fortuitum]|uniref:Ltp family lipoprotein n=1 Tax=Paenibacillus sp. FSL W8-1287 TaxID=2954653 RepID=UPI001F41A1FC|nr:Ltp family lipoprotein [Mycolicibacterium fortuitum]